MMKTPRLEKLNKGLVALLLFGMSYLGLMLFLGTSSPFLLVSGTSMEPTLHTGDLLLNKSVAPTEIKVGDVIAFEVPSEVQQRLSMPPKATHRVVGIEGENGQMVFVTQGDNSDVDPFKVPSSMVRGVVVKNLGPLGWPILLLTNKTLLLFLGIPILTFALIVLATLWLSPSGKSEAPAPKRASARATKDAGGLLPKHVGIPLDRLTSAVSTYGVHLQSHTSIIKGMAGSSEGLKEAVQQQNEILVELASVVREMKYYQGQNGDRTEDPDSVNGRKKARNGARVKKANGRKKNHNADQSERPILSRTREERVEELVAEIKAQASGNSGSLNGTTEPVAQPEQANGSNGAGSPVAQPEQANGSNGTGSPVAQPMKAEASGDEHKEDHNGSHAENPPLSPSREERVQAMVAEMENRIKAKLGWNEESKSA